MALVVDQFLGGGGQGEVYRVALQSQPLAVKWFYPHYLRQDPRLRERLELTWLLREGCVEALAPFEPDAPWEDLFLAQRVRCYREAGHPLENRARKDLAEYMKNAPPRLETGLPP